MTFETDNGNMRLLEADEPVRVPGETRSLGPEQTAITQFNLLVDTYAKGITKLNGEIGGIDGEIATLLAGIARLEKAKATKVQERDTKFNLMEGVNTLIRKQEDLIRDRERSEADEARRAAALG